MRRRVSVPFTGSIYPLANIFLSISIVAVHGLNGDPVNTWKHPKTTHFWLQDSLPHDIKGARILNYGYNADVVFGNSTANIWDHAKSLLGSLIDERETGDVWLISHCSLQTRLEVPHTTLCRDVTDRIGNIGVKSVYHLHCAFSRRDHCETSSGLGA